MATKIPPRSVNLVAILTVLVVTSVVMLLWHPSKPTTILPPARLANLVFSPNQEHLAYIAQDDQRYRIIVTRSDTHEFICTSQPFEFMDPIIASIKTLPSLGWVSNNQVLFVYTYKPNRYFSRIFRRKTEHRLGLFNIDNGKSRTKLVLPTNVHMQFPPKIIPSTPALPQIELHKTPNNLTAIYELDLESNKLTEVIANPNSL